MYTVYLFLMKTQSAKARFAHFLIKSGELVLSIVWPNADERRAAALEIIARTAYTAEESACHYLETIGLDGTGKIRETLEIARSQDTNEQMHEDVFGRDLNGLKYWPDRFLARHVAVLVYWIFAIVTLIDHEFASLLGEAVEVEAVKTYGRMLQEQPSEWLDQAAVPTAISYYKKENNFWLRRGDKRPLTMRDVVEAIRKDEEDHINYNCQKARAF
mgnify:CR=1 FL=1